MLGRLQRCIYVVFTNPSKTYVTDELGQDWEADTETAPYRRFFFMYHIIVQCPVKHDMMISMILSNRRMGNLERDILQQLSAGDLLYGFLLSGHSTRCMYKLARERAASRYRHKRALERLITQEFVRKTGDHVRLTNRGRNELESLATRTKKQLGKKKWDNKWRIVIFDIPEKHAGLRRKVRTVLTRAGFTRLQQSVWIFPHECRELIDLLKEEPRVAPHVLYGTLEHIEMDERLKKIFRL